MRGGKKMNQLIAKIRDRSRTNNKLRKVISDEIVFTLPENLDEAIGYNPSTMLEEEAWYVITSYSIHYTKLYELFQN